MGQLLFRNLDENLRVRLRELARSHDRSAEEEARAILSNALAEHKSTSAGLGTEIAALFRGHGLEEEIQEFRGGLPSTRVPL